MSLFRCPICDAPLVRTNQTYTCPSRHTYDIAREGYVNLLPANQMHSKAPGDDKDMAAARNRFLSQGHYEHLCEKLCQLISAHAPACSAVLDSGCGEGFYTAGIARALWQAGHTPRVAGVDLSKPSLRWAAKREPSVEFAVASVYHLPVADEGVDVLVNCFSPLALDEFRRVLRLGGIFLYVVPAADHLWQLKQVLYDVPYPNTEEDTPYEGFEYLAVSPTARTITLENQQTISDLFQMTPYYWKTPKAGAQRLSQLDHLAVTASFRVHVFRKCF